MIKQYMKLECKRLFNILPGFFAAVFGTALFLFIVLFMAKSLLPEALKVSSLQIGFCVEGENRMSEYFREYIQQMKSTENLMEFQLMDREQAGQALQEGHLTAAIIIPERTAESIIDGTNIPIQVIMGTGTENTEKYLQQKLLSMLTECGAALIDVPQAETLLLYEMQVDNVEELGKMLDLFHFGLVMDRENWFEVQEISAFGSAEMEEYYLAAGLTLLFLFWGLGNGNFYKGEDKQLALLLKRRGISFPLQDLIKQFVFFIPYFILGLGIFTGVSEYSHNFTAVLPVLLLSFMLSLQCSFFFHLAPTVSSGIVMNSIWGIFSFFGAGGMLPAVFLPEAVTRICSRLPAGICMELLLQMTTGRVNSYGRTVGAGLLWCLIFGIGSQFVFYRELRDRR